MQYPLRIKIRTAAERLVKLINPDGTLSSLEASDKLIRKAFSEISSAVMQASSEALALRRSFGAVRAGANISPREFRQLTQAGKEVSQ